nr:MAG TPA: hypothetical protein [Caudoviricetes sp.]
MPSTINAIAFNCFEFTSQITSKLKNIKAFIHSYHTFRMSYQHTKTYPTFLSDRLLRRK